MNIQVPYDRLNTSGEMIRASAKLSETWTTWQLYDDASMYLVSKGLCGIFGPKNYLIENHGFTNARYMAARRIARLEPNSIHAALAAAEERYFTALTEFVQTITEPQR